MSPRRTLLVVALLLTVSLIYSCDQESTSTTDEIYSIDKKEIKDQDT
ncbi:hypothetical protein [Maribacter sp. 2307UL18-2]